MEQVHLKLNLNVKKSNRHLFPLQMEHDENDQMSRDTRNMLMLSGKGRAPLAPI
jgi:hypothetical protein